MPARSNTAILLIDCPDQKGIVATVTSFLYGHNANILHTDQHQESTSGLFFMRVEWDLTDFNLDLAHFADQFAPIAERFEMRWRLERSAVPPRVAIFVSRYDHCLADLLYRHQIGELACEIPLIISNHPDAKPLAEFYGIPFHDIPVQPETKPEAESQQLELLETHEIDLVVLARYMQVLSADFIARYPQRIINVHHTPSFLASAARDRTNALLSGA